MSGSGSARRWLRWCRKRSVILNRPIHRPRPTSSLRVVAVSQAICSCADLICSKQGVMRRHRPLSFLSRCVSPSWEKQASMSTRDRDVFPSSRIKASQPRRYRMEGGLERTVAQTLLAGCESLVALHGSIQLIQRVLPTPQAAPTARKRRVCLVTSASVGHEAIDGLPDSGQQQVRVLDKRRAIVVLCAAEHDEVAFPSSATQLRVGWPLTPGVDYVRQA